MITARDPIVRCRDYGFALSKSVKAKKVWKPGEQVDFQWMPGGVHAITASYGRGDRNVPIELWVHCNEAGARRVQQSFEQIMATNSRRPPFICIEHQAKERAGQPVGFKWGVIEHDQGSDTGIICTCDPSALGANNVNGKIHTSFSPTFDTDADYSQLRCTGCAKDRNGCQCASPHAFAFARGARGSQENPAEVTRLDAQSVGSLTNWNAFKEILPIAAREPETVKAGGTSEGAKKGWEHRGNIAHDLSAKADIAEQEADDSATIKTYRKAADIHHKASRAHREAADAASEEGYKDAATVHEQAASFHYRKSIGLHAKGDSVKSRQPTTAAENPNPVFATYPDLALASVKADEAEASVKATWSDAAREAAAEARRNGSHAGGDEHDSSSEGRLLNQPLSPAFKSHVIEHLKNHIGIHAPEKVTVRKSSDVEGTVVTLHHAGKRHSYYTPHENMSTFTKEKEGQHWIKASDLNEDNSFAIMQAHAEVIVQAELAMVKAQETNNRDDVQALRELIKASNGKILEHGEQVTDTIFTRALKSDAAVRAIALRVEPVDDKFEDTETVFARLAERVAETNRLLEGKAALPKTDDDMVREIMARTHNPAENVTATGTSEGAEKGWEHRMRLSEEAHYATKIALGARGSINEDALYKEARDRHTDAAKAYRSASSESRLVKEDNEGRAKEHEALAAHHQQVMDNVRGYKVGD